MTRKALPYILAAALIAGGASAQVAKAPQGSRDEAIKITGYCNGQAQARIRNLLLVFSDKERSTGVSAVYVSDKMQFLGGEMTWMSKAFVALGNAVENPDVGILNGGIARGRAEGKQFAEIEEQCRQSCAEAKDVDALKMCVDACAEKTNPVLSHAAKGCDTTYAKEHPGK